MDRPVSRTPEQKHADNLLAEAIDTALVAHGIKTGVASEYIVLVAQHRFSDNGNQYTSIARLTSDDGVPHYRLLGLLDYAATCYRADLTEPDEED
jgi:hypothetical protein